MRQHRVYAGLSFAAIVVLAAACSGGPGRQASRNPGKGTSTSSTPGGSAQVGGGTGHGSTTSTGSPTGSTSPRGTKGNSSGTTSTTAGGTGGGGGGPGSSTTTGTGGSGTTSTTAGNGTGPTTTTSQPGTTTTTQPGQTESAFEVVQRTSDITLAAGSTAVDFDFNIQPGCSAFAGHTIAGSITGLFSFAKDEGQLSLDTPGSDNLLENILAGSNGDTTTPTTYVDKTLYIEPLPGSVASIGDDGAKYAIVDLATSAQVIGVDLNGLSSLLSGNPAQFIQIFDTYAMTVADDGAAEMGGEATTHYHVTIDLAQAAAEGGKEQHLYAALAKVPGQSSLGLDLWIDAKGRTVAIDAPLLVPSTSSTAIGLTLSVLDTKFGVSVPNVDTPPSDEVGQLPTIPPVC